MKWITHGLIAFLSLSLASGCQTTGYREGGTAVIFADRGCEGTLVSYPSVMSVFIGKIKTSFGGLDRSVPLVMSGNAPPDPGGGQ